MGHRRGAADPVSGAMRWAQKQPVRVKVTLGAVTVLLSLLALKIFVRDRNHFFVASEAVHAAGIMVLIYKLTRRKTCSGHHHHHLLVLFHLIVFLVLIYCPNFIWIDLWMIILD